MTGILDHVWGVSPAQDRVWAQVAGIAPSAAGRRLFMPFQAYIDDSYRPDAVFVLAGHIAAVETWAKFSKDWEQLLRPFGTLSKQNRTHPYHFKMSEMALSQERMSRVPVFFRVLQEHVLVSVSCKINIIELKRAISRVYIHNKNLDWGMWSNPFFVCFRCLIDSFHIHRPQISSVIPLDDPIDFYFDVQSEKGAIIAGWDEYIKQRPDDVAQYYGAMPRFEKDEEFLPLQAADLFAWWVRKSYEDGKIDELKRYRFGGLEPRRRPRCYLRIEFDEEQLVRDLTNMARGHAAPGTIIYDVQFSVE